jgi:hypothetical protein
MPEDAKRDLWIWRGLDGLPIARPVDCVWLEEAKGRDAGRFVAILGEPVKLAPSTVDELKGIAKMAKRGCGYGKCPYQPMRMAERMGVTAFFSGLVVMWPIANAIGLGFSQDFKTARLVFSISAVIPVAAWMGSIYVAYKEDTDHYWTVILNAIGLPGTIVTILLALSK